MGPLVTREHRDKVASYIEGGAGAGRDDRRRRPRPAPDGDGFFLGVSLLDNVTTEMDAYKRRDLRAVLAVVRVETYDEARARSSTTTRTGTASRCSRGTAAPPGSSSSTSMPAWSASTSRSRCPSRTTRSAAGRRRCSGTRHVYGPGVDPLLHAREGRHVAVARSGDQQGRPRVPADTLRQTADVLPFATNRCRISGDGRGGPAAPPRSLLPLSGHGVSYGRTGEYGSRSGR